MKPKFLYTKKALRYFRIISVICALFLIITEIINSFNYGLIVNMIKNGSLDQYVFYTRVSNMIVIVLFIVVAVFPHKFGIFMGITFMYTITIVPFEPENYMGLLMYFLGISTLFARGLMHNHKKTKLIILGVLYCALLFTHLRFGFHNFIKYIVINMGAMLVLVLSIFFLQAYYTNSLVFEDKKLNLADYPGLNERDCQILQKIQRREKYSVIAHELGVAEGTLKNRLHEVFTTLNTGDRQGFMSIYGDYDVLFTDIAIIS